MRNLYWNPHRLERFSNSIMPYVISYHALCCNSNFSLFRYSLDHHLRTLPPNCRAVPQPLLLGQHCEAEPCGPLSRLSCGSRHIHCCKFPGDQCIFCAYSRSSCCIWPWNCISVGSGEQFVWWWCCFGLVSHTHYIYLFFVMLLLHCTMVRHSAGLLEGNCICMY